MTLTELLKTMKERAEADLQLSKQLIQPEKSWLRDIDERARLIAALELAIQQRNERMDHFKKNEARYYNELWQIVDRVEDEMFCDADLIKILTDGGM